MIARLLALGRSLLRRLVALEVIDRSLVIGAQAFGALIPLLIVLASVGGRQSESLGDALVQRFGLSGAGADTVRQMFAAPAHDGTITAVGVIVVALSALAFARALQRTFERAWDLPRRGMRSTGWGLIWLGAFSLYWFLFPLLRGVPPGPVGTACALAVSFALWLVTPYLLLARRIPWRGLILQAALTAIGMTALGAAAALYVPRAVSRSAAEYGSIGVAFTLLSLLWAAGFVIVTAAVIGASTTLPAWLPTSPGSVTPPSSSSSPARGS